jgi:uncharacterized protein (TIGR02596 family)
MVSRSARTAFSLVELLVVVAIIAILAGLSVTGFNSILRSSRLDQAGRAVLDEINLARQVASARNENVELRFIRRPRDDGSGSNVYWQVQSGVLSVTGTTTNFSPLRPAASLPAGTAMETNATLSPLLAWGQEKTQTNPNYKFVALTVRPTGEVEPVNTPPVNALPQWCITIVPERQMGQPLAQIADFVTIQIDPLTSRPRSYRP